MVMSHTPSILPSNGMSSSRLPYSATLESPGYPIKNSIEILTLYDTATTLI